MQPYTAGPIFAYSLAKMGELPEIFERKIWFGSNEGLFITAGLGLLFTYAFDMEGVASITCGIYIILYIFVIYSPLRLRKLVGGNRILIIINLFCVSAVFILLLIYQFDAEPSVFYGLIITLAVTVPVEFFVRYGRKRKIGMRTVSTSAEISRKKS